MPFHRAHPNPPPSTQDSNQDVHILPVVPSEGQNHGEMPSKLTEGNSFTGAEPVTTQPGPVISIEIGGIKPAASDALDQRAAELNKPQHH